MSWYSSSARCPGRVWGTNVSSIPLAQRNSAGRGPGSRGFDIDYDLFGKAATIAQNIWRGLWNGDLSVAAGSGFIDSSRHRRNFRLDLGPTRGEKDHHSQSPRAQVLLVLQILVRGHQNLEAGSL